jgi:hypothetical protein
MENSLIKIYKDNPTAGRGDGTLVSSGDGLNPIESGAIKVPASGYQEGAWVKLALRCDAGYETVLDEGRHAQISIIGGEHVDKWQLAPDAAGPNVEGAIEWGEPLNLYLQINDTNTIFWSRARVANTEGPANDRSVQLKVTATIGAQ